MKLTIQTPLIFWCLTIALSLVSAPSSRAASTARPTHNVAIFAYIKKADPLTLFHFAEI